MGIMEGVEAAPARAEAELMAKEDMVCKLNATRQAWAVAMADIVSEPVPYDVRPWRG